MILLNKNVNVPYKHSLKIVLGQNTWLLHFKTVSELQNAFDLMTIENLQEGDPVVLTKKIVIVKSDLAEKMTIIEPSETDLCPTGFTRQFILDQIDNNAHAVIYGNEIGTYISAIEDSEIQTEAQKELDRLNLFYGDALTANIIILVQDFLPESLINLLNPEISFYTHDLEIGASTKFSYKLAIRLTNE